jgi:hypothetical protein
VLQPKSALPNNKDEALVSFLNDILRIRRRSDHSIGDAKKPPSKFFEYGGTSNWVCSSHPTIIPQPQRAAKS